jgi:hypothetical protein
MPVDFGIQAEGLACSILELCDVPNGVLRRNCMADEEVQQRLVLLNRLVSVSTTRATEDNKPPMFTGREALELIQRRKEKNWAIEYFGLHETAGSLSKEDERIKSGKGHDFIWLREIKFQDKAQWRFAVMLFEFIDQSKVSFSVVDTVSLEGNEIRGKKNDRGARSAHVVVRLPIKQYDDRSYRCVIEVSRSITRADIEHFLCKQLRRQAAADELSFHVRWMDAKGKPKEYNYRYTPRLELFADIGRKIDFALSGGRELSHMTFTKRHERRSIGKDTEVKHEDVIADVELRVSAKQGPDDPDKRLGWLAQVRSYFESIGYESRMFYRNLGGGIMSGHVHQDMAGATDIVMCQKELISLSDADKEWYPKIDDELVGQMITHANTDDLWERSK